MLKSLSEIASFNVAKLLWSCYEGKKVIPKPCKNFQIYEDEPSSIAERLNRIYPRLPTSIRRAILDNASLIDKELRRREASDMDDEVTDFDDISWTHFFTIDKVRSSCKTKGFNFTSKTLCECCCTMYVSAYKSNLDPRDIRRLRRFFGEYEDHVILYWHWYGRQNRSLSFHLTKYTQHYGCGSYKPIENVFKFCVFMEYEVAVLYYWANMSTEQRTGHYSSIIPLLLLESDYLEFITIKVLLPSETFLFFWEQLDSYERHEIIQSHFIDVYRYLVFHQNGVLLLQDVLQEWTPTGITPVQYFKVLKLSVETNNIDLFVLVWKRKITALSFDQLGYLLWTLLLDKDKDFALATMILNDYDEQQVDVLNELDVYIVNMNVDFEDRVNQFLSAASLEHLRAAGFPRNPKRRDSPKNRRRTSKASRSRRGQPRRLHFQR